MKKIYKKEEGVSPVIATILMVAITVVLAATVWLMVSGYLSPTKPALQGTLQYDYQTSNLDKGWANFTLLLSQPSEGLNPTAVHFTVNGTGITYLGTIGGTPPASHWTFIDNDGDNKLSNGDIIIIHYDKKLIHNAGVSFGATGCSGSIKTTIP